MNADTDEAPLSALETAATLAAIGEAPVPTGSEDLTKEIANDLKAIGDHLGADRPLEPIPEDVLKKLRKGTFKAWQAANSRT